MQERKLVVQAYIDDSEDRLSENGIKANYDEAIRYLGELDQPR